MVFRQYATHCILSSTSFVVLFVPLPCHASLNRTCIILVCASCHVDVLVIYYVVCFFSGDCFFGLVPITSHLWGFVRLRPFVFFMDSFFFLAGSQARWPYPRNHFYLCLLVVRSIAMPWYLPLAISCLPYCHVKPLTILSQQTIVWLSYRFCSALLIALLVAGEFEVGSMLKHGYFGLSQYLLFN